MSRVPYNVYKLNMGPLACHAWGPDKTELVVTTEDSPIIYMLKSDGKHWFLLHTLDKHDMHITGIDWAKKTNRIASCGADKSTYVWNYTNGAWKPQLVLTRSTVAEMCVQWSPNEKKLAVGSASSALSICYYEKEQDWWVAKQIKKAHSPLSCTAWHPSSLLIATGSFEGRIRVHSAVLKEIGEEYKPNPWGHKAQFGSTLFANNSKANINACAFSPSGEKLAWVSQNSCVHFVDAKNLENVQTIKCKGLPFKGLQWLTESSFVAAGYDYDPVLYSVANDKLTCIMRFQMPSTENISQKLAAMAMFQCIDKKATDEATEHRSKKSLHQNTITDIEIHTNESDKSDAKFSTISFDGSLVIWSANKSQQ